MSTERIRELKPDSLPFRSTEFLKQFYEYGKIECYEDVLDSVNFTDRMILVDDISVEVGRSVSGMIQFYNQMDRQLGIAPEDRQPIKLYVDSNGGNVFAALSIIDAIELSETPVYTINTGTAFSAGCLILVAGHKRFAYPNSTFLIHEGSTGAYHDAGKFRNYAHFYEQMLDRTKDLLLSKTKITEEQYNEKRNDDWWFFPEEALELGVCDEIVKSFI